jgi:hypothetical protein
VLPKVNDPIALGFEEFVVRLFKQILLIHKVRSPDGLKSARDFDFVKGYPSTKED